MPQLLQHIFTRLSDGGFMKKLYGVGLLALGFSAAAFAQTNVKVDILLSDTTELYTTITKNFIQTLGENGFVVGKNLTITQKSIGNDAVKGEAVFSEVLKNEPNLVFVAGTMAAKVAGKLYMNDGKNNFVYAGVTDAVGVGLVSGIGEAPNANFTGVSYPVPVKARLKFVKKIMPSVKKIGLVYADMPQSLSYKKWLEDAIKDPELAGVQIIYKSVPLITGEGGVVKMVASAKPAITELESQVDLFLSPNDQMGVSGLFPKMVAETTKKPLIGLGKNDVMQDLGAVAVVYPSHEKMGQQAGDMAAKILKGTSIKTVLPEWVAETGVAINMKVAQQQGIAIPMSIVKLAGDNIVK
jgi:putative ABC transport system substrate-binding protein